MQLEQIGAKTKWIALGAALILYLLLFALAVTPGKRLREQEERGFTRDSQILAANKWEIFRYYGSYQGDFYYYFEFGMRFAGIPLPPLDSQIAKRFARAKDDSVKSREPLLPYRDFESVYPVMAVQYFRVMSQIFREPDSFYQGLRWVHLAAMAATIGIGYLIVGGEASTYLFCALLWMVAMGPRLLCMFDILPALLVVVASYGAKRQWWWLCGCALSAGVLIKVYPAFLVPLFLIYAWRIAAWRGLVQLAGWGLVGTVAIVWPWVPYDLGYVWKGFMGQGVRQYLEYGSLMGSVLVQLRQLGWIDFRYDSELDSIAIISSLSHTLARTSPLLMGALSLGISGWMWKRSRELRGQAELLRLLLYGCAGVVMAVLAGSMVFSPQYQLWLFGVMLLVVKRLPEMWVAALFFAIIQIQHPILEGFGESIKEPGRVIVFLIRNFALLLLMNWWWRGRETGIFSSSQSASDR